MCCQKNLIIGSSSLGWALGFLIYAESTCKQYNLANALDDNAIADSSKFLLPAFEYKTTEVRKQSLWFMVYDACIQKVTQRGLSNFLLYISFGVFFCALHTIDPPAIVRTLMECSNVEVVCPKVD